VVIFGVDEVQKIAMAHTEDVRLLVELRAKKNADADWKADRIAERIERRKLVAAKRGVSLEGRNE
jgi:hypothetical protein